MSFACKATKWSRGGCRWRNFVGSAPSEFPLPCGPKNKRKRNSFATTYSLSSPKPRTSLPLTAHRSRRSFPKTVRRLTTHAHAIWFAASDGDPRSNSPRHSRTLLSLCLLGHLRFFLSYLSRYSHISTTHRRPRIKESAHTHLLIPSLRSEDNPGKSQLSPRIGVCSCSFSFLNCLGSLSCPGCR